MRIEHLADVWIYLLDLVDDATLTEAELRERAEKVIIEAAHLTGCSYLVVDREQREECDECN